MPAQEHRLREISLPVIRDETEIPRRNQYTMYVLFRKMGTLSLMVGAGAVAVSAVRIVSCFMMDLNDH
jgi:hypothetical protein